ncbi:MAG: hypothetical protein A3B23_04025 [Candidatus Colwellbacteria bacterium RIFCSPLOWO2_01_FULL_48_10]|uniref:Uncharacterized protein n=2 Tax=Bacteria candidate phyla TaxID=1783234 RepID=A0A1F5P2T9_9BACT|nr:MAG: hypothetical protein A2846_01310 [Candidatus Doudnabacteria bacterium RIFCSPHIGHO2_01_FULL_49_9]OGY60192.1 MAG: hypothetical protein A3B23_04025 [Candidatus Colwellbacteria bacterium RIFCSPLOWO2_01_FULL_48_10]
MQRQTSIWIGLAILGAGIVGGVTALLLQQAGNHDLWTKILFVTSIAMLPVSKIFLFDLLPHHRDDQPDAFDA